MTLLEIADARRTNGASAVREIAEALLELGGSAHRDAVVDRVSIRRGQGRVSDDLKLELVAAFDRHCAVAARKGRPALFCVPFGEGSRRWSLTPEAMQSVREEAPSTTVTVLPVDREESRQVEIASAA